MTMTAAVGRPPLPPLLLLDGRKTLFSLASFLAAAATLWIAFAASLPRPWWAILTVYVTAQPMAGAFRPKVFYRLGGLLVGAGVAVALVPALEHAPELLALSLAAWAGICIYLAVLDRTPRAFLFQMAAFSSAVISFPYVDDPGDMFITAVSRVEEMTVAIVSVTLAHALIQPWSVIPAIRSRAATFLADASLWARQALSGRHGPLEYERRRKLAADVAELGMLAVHLPFDQRGAPATRLRVLALQERLAAVLPLATGAADRLDALRALGPLEPEVAGLLRDVEAWLAARADAPPAVEEALAARCRDLRDRYLARADWPALVAASLCQRLTDFLDAHQESRVLAGRVGDASADDDLPPSGPRFRLARDHGLAALAGLATATALGLYCAVWIMLAWPSGAATAAFAALITCSFAAQDDPAPVIMRYLGATLVTFPIAALYLFVILPRVDGAGLLIATLAPTLLTFGYIQADPARSPLALPMFSCLIVALGFLARFQADFANFINTGLAQVGGIIGTLVVTKLFRSANARWSARRIVRGAWADLADLADIRGHADAARWTALAVDRLGQVAARMAQADPSDALHAADGLADLRIGRNVIRIRRALPATPHDGRRALGDVLAEVSSLFAARVKSGAPEPAPASLRQALDRALGALQRLDLSEPRRDALIALVSLRCTLFPTARAPGAAP
jgi:uncharacterized membrane protein YccC